MAATTVEMGENNFEGNTNMKNHFEERGDNRNRSGQNDRNRRNYPPKRMRQDQDSNYLPKRMRQDPTGSYPSQRMRQDSNRERAAYMGGPTVNLPMREGEPKKSSGRCRLFVGNLPSSITDEDFRNLFKPFGEIDEVFLNATKGFGFVRLDTKQNAEAAKAELDSTIKDGKTIRVKFATQGAALKVKHLSVWVSNELLEAAFSMFGDVERAVVIVDDKGRSVGEGIVEYSRKQAAQQALKRCHEGCFLLTSSSRPVLVEPLEQRDEEVGLPEKSLQKSNPQYLEERNVGPRLAEPGTSEYHLASRWKDLYEVERLMRERLEKEILEDRHQLQQQMEYLYYEHEADSIREQLRYREEQGSMLQRKREMKLEEERHHNEQYRQALMMLRQREDEILGRRPMDGFRRMEDSVMMQPSSHSDMLNRQGAAFHQLQGAVPRNINEHMNRGGPPINPGMLGPVGLVPPPQFDQPPPNMIIPQVKAENNDKMDPPHPQKSE